MKVLICGSRDLKPTLLPVVERVVSQLCHSYIIVCGDAVGVDLEVARMAWKYNACLLMYGLQPKPRNGAKFNLRSRYFWMNELDSYESRDRYMVQTVGKNGFVLCIWNGSSPGTKAVYDYAQELEINSLLWQEGSRLPIIEP